MTKKAIQFLASLNNENEAKDNDYMMTRNFYIQSMSLLIPPQTKK